jgi:hypothetical protein
MVASSLLIGVASAKAPIPGPISISLPIVPTHVTREAPEFNPASLGAGLVMLGGIFLLAEHRRKRKA